jgi:hypothetical protein
MGASVVANPSCFILCTVLYYNCGPKYFRKNASPQRLFRNAARVSCIKCL